MQLWLSTLRALLAPHRLVPLLLATAAVLAAELLFQRGVPATHTARMLGVDLLLALAFVAVAPAGWRLLCGPERRVALMTGLGSWVGYLAFVVLCAAVVSVIGWILPPLVGVSWTYLTEPPGLVVVFVLFAVGGWGLGRDVGQEAGLRAATDRAELLAAEAEQAQLLALRAHLDPHFLFNTLNAIAEWCVQDPVVAERATLHLARMLRTIMQGVRVPHWPLARELELVRSLFDLYQLRDPERYRFAWEGPGSLPEVSLPPMILLPLVENAIKHGPAAGYVGSVGFVVRVRDEVVEFHITNPADGARSLDVPGGGGASGGREADADAGEGLKLVDRRLALAFGDRARWSLRRVGDRVEANVQLPRDPIGRSDEKDAIGRGCGRRVPGSPAAGAPPGSDARRRSGRRLWLG